MVTGVALATDDTITEDLHAEENANMLLKLVQIKECASVSGLKILGRVGPHVFSNIFFSGKI